MNATIKRATFEITDEEAIDLFHALKRDLEYTIDTHWNRHLATLRQDPIRQLVKAGALIAAEIDRRQRAGEVNIAGLPRAGNAATPTLSNQSNP